MLTVLQLADRQVKQQLFDAVQAAGVPVMVTLVRAGPGMKPIPEREPFRTLETELGVRLLQLVVADEGKAEGMWRDPVGDLAEDLYPEDRSSASLASAGYLLVHRGQPVAAVKKLAALEDDADQILAALGKAGLAGARPPPSAPPPPRSASASAAAVARPELEPYALLGISRATSRAEARRAFRALMAQYHPDKVAHLAPDFRELAEQRSRALTRAWELIQGAFEE